MYNNVTLIGKLVKEPKIFSGKDGKSFASIKIETWSIYQGTRYSSTHTCTVGERLMGELAGVQEGDSLLVTGSLKNRKYQEDGKEKYATEVYAVTLSRIAGGVTEGISFPSTTWTGTSEGAPF